MASFFYETIITGFETISTIITQGNYDIYKMTHWIFITQLNSLPNIGIFGND